MSDRPADRSPHLPLLVVLALAVSTVLAAAWVSRSVDHGAQPKAAIQQVRELNFVDQPDGSIAVIDTVSGAEVHRVVGEAGFVRGVLRAMARERRRLGYGPAAPFQIIAWADGRFGLRDTATGRSIELNSFGPTNVGAFAQLLRSDGGAS